MERISRSKALKKGLDLYFTGKPCGSGNISPRSVSGYRCLCGDCAQRNRDRAAAWGAENQGKVVSRVSKWKADNPIRAREISKASRKRCAEKEADRAKSYYLENKEAISKRQSEYRAANVEKARERNRKWSLENRDMATKRQAARRAKKARATPPWYGELDDLVMSEAFSLARARHIATGFAWHVDHIVPISCKTASGLHCASNIQVIPAHLNFKKNRNLRFMEPMSWLREGI